MIPSSSNPEKTFLSIIRTIGPINIPITPNNLNPVYIEAIVKIG